MELKIKKLREGAHIPKRATAGSAGMDLYACIPEAVTLAPGQLRVIPTGIAIELPLANGVGVIDSDYRGEICVGLCNVSDKPYVIAPEERVAQMVIAPVLLPEIVESDALSGTERGAGGFGSTGKS